LVAADCDPSLEIWPDAGGLATGESSVIGKLLGRLISAVLALAV
jgi:hypothetical protein